MTRSRRRLLALLSGLPVLLMVVALLYMVGMDHLEGRPRDFWSSLEWAAETLTTTGYGSDSHWSHPLMILFVIGLQFVGVLMIYLVFPIYLIPALEERFETRLPRRFRELTGHVLIYRFGMAVEGLLEQLERQKVPYLIMEEDEATVRRLRSAGRNVVFTPEGSMNFDVTSLQAARALIANGRDDENAGVILAARTRGFTGEIIALAEEPFHRWPLELTGATAVFTPRHILATALAARASTRISPRLAGIQQIGSRLEVSEVRVPAESPLVGRTLAEAAIGARTGVTVIGQWIQGRLMTGAIAQMRLEPRGILIVAGSQEAIARLEGLAETRQLRRDGHFVVAGYGEVGKKVVQLLRDAGEEVRVIERRALEGVDVPGNVLEEAVLNQAEIARAQAVILALDTDDATLFAAVIIKDLVPDLPVYVRVNQARNLEGLRQAGADFALSLSQVSGQMLARRLLGEEAVLIDPTLKLFKVPGSVLESQHPSSLEIRERTGCSVVAVERGEGLITQFGTEFCFEERDVVYLCGTPQATAAFRQAYPERA